MPYVATVTKNQAYKETQEAVTIASNKRKAREVLYTPSAPLKEKVNAAAKLAKVYERTGTIPRGRDAKILQYYRLNEDRFNAIIIVDDINNEGVKWKSKKDVKHLAKRKAMGHIPQNWSISDYENKVKNLCNNPETSIYLYQKKGLKQKYYVFGDGDWIAIFGQNKVIDTAFKVDKMPFEEYIEQQEMKILGTVKDVMLNE